MSRSVWKGGSERALPLFPTRRKSAIFAPIVRLKSQKTIGSSCAVPKRPLDILRSRPARSKFAATRSAGPARPHERSCVTMSALFFRAKLLPHLAVERNITLALTLVKKQPRDAAQTKAAEVLRLVGLSDKINSYPEQLSGGQHSTPFGRHSMSSLISQPPTEAALP
jgi:ABC-type glutathione transport system ATPase component